MTTAISTDIDSATGIALHGYAGRLKRGPKLSNKNRDILDEFDLVHGQYVNGPVHQRNTREAFMLGYFGKALKAGKALSAILEDAGEVNQHCCDPMFRPGELKAGLQRAVMDNRGIALPVDPNTTWPDFARTPKGDIKAVLDNVVLALQRPDLCGADLAFDTFRDEIMTAPIGTQDWRPLTDSLQAKLRRRIEKDLGFPHIEARNMREGLLVASDKLQFDGGQKWLDTLKWDGVPRVETFVSKYFGAADTEYTRAVGLYMWSAMAGRILTPGVKADMVPVLVSDQGWRKSAGVAALVPAPEFFRELSLDQKDDNLARQVRGKLVCELAELSGLGKADLEWLKTWITRQHEEWVRKYQEHMHRYPRRGIFIGTSNRDDFLIDETGNRRWLPFRLERKVDVDAIAFDRAQLWAEGASLYLQNGVMYRQAEELAPAEHAQFAYHDSWVQPISEWLARAPVDAKGNLLPTPREREFITTGEVLTCALGIDSGRIQRSQEMRIGAIMRGLRYSNRKVWANGVRINGWMS